MLFETITPAEQKAQTTALNRSKAQRRFKDITTARRGLWALQALDPDILNHMGVTYEQVRTLSLKLRESTRALSKSFHVCNSCNKALRGRNLRKDSKRGFSNKCALCGTVQDAYAANFTIRQIRHTTNLETAKAYMQENHPEIYL